MELWPWLSGRHLHRCIRPRCCTEKERWGCCGGCVGRGTAVKCARHTTRSWPQAVTILLSASLGLLFWTFYVKTSPSFYDLWACSLQTAGLRWLGLSCKCHLCTCHLTRCCLWFVKWGMIVVSVVDRRVNMERIQGCSGPSKESVSLGSC